MTDTYQEMIKVHGWIGTAAMMNMSRSQLEARVYEVKGSGMRVSTAQLLQRISGTTLFAQTVAAEAVTVAERLRQCVEQATWPAGLKLTGSFGVAQADEAQAMEAALKAADLAMYQAKQQGRNRVQLKAQERGAAPD